MKEGLGRHGVFLTRVLLAALLVQLWLPARAWGDETCPGASASFAGGDGSAECPFLIATADHLNNVRDHLDAHFRLIADIDLAGTDYNNWLPIGNYGIGKQFTGTLDGNGHKIINMTISRMNMLYTGLFGYIGAGAVIQNIGLVNVNVIASAIDYTGGLVGYNDQGTITNVYVTGVISALDTVGGLTGMNRQGVITDSYAAVTINGGYVIGGLIGINERGTIADSYATGNVSGIYAVGVGGLIGQSVGGSVTNAYATGNVIGSNHVGGLVGSILESGQTITRSHATGAVTATGDFVGGLVGMASDGSIIADSYATGSVTSEGTYIPSSTVNLQF